MDEDARNRLLSKPVVRVVRWIVPWVALALVLNSAWGVASDYREALSRDPRPARPGVTQTVDASITPMVGARVYAVAASVTLFDSPDMGGAALEKLKKGASMEVVEERPGWFRVRDSVGNIGWVTSDAAFISEVKPPVASKTPVKKKPIPEVKIRY